jgi:hypothetical protein
MAISEQSRHRLYQRLEELLGSEEGTTLMQHLPPVGWADVATTRDLDALADRTDARFDLVDARFDAIAGRFDDVTDRVDHRFQQFTSVIDARFDAVGHQIHTSEQGLRAEFQRDLRLQGYAIVAALSAVMAILTAAGRFL